MQNSNIQQEKGIGMDVCQHSNCYGYCRALHNKHSK